MKISPTVEQVIREPAGPATGFDYLRVMLALGVLLVHVAVIADHAFWVELWTTWFGPIERAILPAFFSLSGFLVAGSLLRNSIPRFLTLRVLRIFPALAVEVILSAILMGLAFTKLRWIDYLAAPEFRAYFLNIAGDVHFTLPGVFGGRKLNEQLWTIPYELECYLVLTALALVALVRRKDIFALILITATLTVTAMAVKLDLIQEGWNVPPRVMVIAFLYGVLGYLYRERLPHSRVLFAFSLAASYAGLYWPNFVYFAAMPLTYVIIYVGVLRWPKMPFGDLSYGIYLFHYPLAVCIHELSGRAMPWPVLLPLTIVSSAAAAWLSWTFVEKPILDRKSAITGAVDAALKWPLRRRSRRAAARA